MQKTFENAPGISTLVFHNLYLNNIFLYLYFVYTVV